LKPEYIKIEVVKIKLLLSAALSISFFLSTFFGFAVRGAFNRLAHTKLDVVLFLDKTGLYLDSQLVCSVLVVLSVLAIGSIIIWERSRSPDGKVVSSGSKYSETFCQGLLTRNGQCFLTNMGLFSQNSFTKILFTQ